MAAVARRAVTRAVKGATTPPVPVVQSTVVPSQLPRLKGHLASQPVPIPAGVKVEVVPGLEDRQLTVTGPNGTQTFGMFENIYVDLESDPRQAQIKSTDDGSKKEHRARWGLTRAMLANMVTGVTQGFTTNLRLVGVGYRAAAEPSETGGQRLRMKLGFSHDVLMEVPEGITAEVPRPTEITLKAFRKDTLGQFAADIRHWRRPEPYNGKGIFINDETIRLKQVKR
ncbi:ribosomal protein L6 [Calocera viscosa TUFC12733]|uniref:Ribosomal protein L6 n=1 Tax=Calocera viscosa (strain TUFC12733) TaxID=1330018 RepID=A0A167K504_CALVF|nr:ribosomal protein L6 [Calocera viscosa TUFC12733]